MHSLHSMSNSRAQAVTLAGILLLGIGQAWPQTATPQNGFAADPFTSFHASLSRAADKALAVPVRPSPKGPGNNSASLATSIVPSTAQLGRPTQAISRVQQLRPIIEPILREEKVPTELAAVVLVESGGQPSPLSPKGARGIWQFMPDTARRYGLTVSRERDERLDIQRSTRAAARYLHDLYSQFGDWQLAFAAYNAGGDLVQRAIERNHTSDFSLLSSRGSLPLETRRYVPAVLDAMQNFGDRSGSVAPLRTAKVAWILYAGTRLATNETEFLRKGELK